MKWMAILLFGWFLQGCATLDGKPIKPAPSLAIPTQWQAQGRAGVSMGKRNQNIGFVINAKNQDYTLKLSATLGLGQINIKSNTQSLWVDGKIIESNLEQWMSDEFGWYFPIQKLAPILFQHKQSVDDGWQVKITSYQQINGVSYPRIVHLNHLTKAIKIKLLISEVNELK
jgi:outer membrane biogenesis lipoprotein LolB